MTGIDQGFGSSPAARLNHHRVPAYAVLFACFCALVMTARGHG